ncbi:hypothetical protein RF11_08275 [Thelohanellus kitauei]|uniref:Uncharacterized protein n=1 Tax=Thelohanellus kitauei TaxID=669202 RepID=A0A0C2MWV6_THEKT|nr:hypothetical protein RF11_08275 [Thelohanellus kitauei]
MLTDSINDIGHSVWLDSAPRREWPYNPRGQWGTRKSDIAPCPKRGFPFGILDGQLRSMEVNPYLQERGVQKSRLRTREDKDLARKTAWLYGPQVGRRTDTDTCCGIIYQETMLGARRKSGIVITMHQLHYLYMIKTTSHEPLLNKPTAINHAGWIISWFC